MKYYELNKNEEQTLKEYEKGQFKAVKNSQSARKEYTLLAKQSFEKTRNVNIRITQGDLLKVKSLAAQKGIPYQTLITSLIHQYSTGKMKTNVI
ncbi:MAG: hypothetical protein HYV32_06480 [Candidatus Kerfeldbacteria bacterium]|nr:hypothetical protein [Candidatus Kerfeldbacteria bacterium]